MSLNFNSDYKLLNQYGVTYWSGEDFSMKIKDVLLDEGTQLTYQSMERVQPFYDYSEYVARDLPHGTRIVSGELTINLTQFSYIFALLSSIDGKSKESQISQIGPPNPQTKFNPTIATGPSFNSATADTTTIASYTKAYNAQQAAKGNAIQKVYNTNPDINNDSGMFETLNEFDLDLIFGMNINNSKVLAFSPDANWLERSTVYDPSKFNQSSGKVNPGTGIRLKACHFFSMSSTIDDSGRNTMQTLQFMAKNIESIK